MYITSCLDLNNCPAEDRLYDIVCDFQIKDQYYMCNISNTCTRTDGKTDCCASYTFDCIVDANSLTSPTIQPTISYENVLCNNGCNNKDRTNEKCYWYEYKNSEIYCRDKRGKDVCCSANREDCCIVRLENVYITFGCLTVIIALALACVYCKKHKIRPVAVRSIDQEL
jgi:hypothetical protein